MIDDRRNKGWHGFLLPEHREALETILDQEEPLLPTELTEDRLEEIQYALEEGLNSEYPLVCEYIAHQKRCGFCGFIESINQHERWLLLQNGSQRQKIYFSQIQSLEVVRDVAD
jgi:hypothetical protein